MEVETKVIEVYLRGFAQECFDYKDGKIDGTDLGMAQVYCAVKIKELFKDKNEK